MLDVLLTELSLHSGLAWSRLVTAAGLAENHILKLVVPFLRVWK